MNNQERRRSKRVEVTQAIDMGCSTENFIQAKSVNISRHGILLECPEPVELCDRIYLMLNFEGKSDKEYTCEGLVVRSEKSGDKYHVAVEFTDFCQEDLDLLIGEEK